MHQDKERITIHERTHSDDVLRTGLRGEHTEDAGTAADVEDKLVLEEVGVVDDRVAVRARAHGVLQHLLVDTCSASGHAMSKSRGSRGREACSPKCAYESA